jgi:hypothetical protein
MPFFSQAHLRPRSRFRHAVPQINELMDTVSGLDRLKVGPGLGMLATSAGRVLYATEEDTTRLAKTDGAGIPPISGTVPGHSDTVTMYTFDGDHVSVGPVQTVFNISTTAVGANKWLIIQRIGQFWFVIVEAC